MLLKLHLFVPSMQVEQEPQSPEHELHVSPLLQVPSPQNGWVLPPVQTALLHVLPLAQFVKLPHRLQPLLREHIWMFILLLGLQRMAPLVHSLLHTGWQSWGQL
jgi:hypothetical protein